MRAGNSGNDDCAERTRLHARSVPEGPLLPDGPDDGEDARRALSRAAVSDAANPSRPVDASTEMSTSDAPAETASEAGTTDAAEAEPAGDASDGGGPTTE